MRTYTFLLAALATSIASAQNILDFSAGALPACAQNCALLQQAQAGCLPTVSPQPASCFCQSSYLTALKTSASAVCADVCPSATEQQEVQTWYINWCQNGGSASYIAKIGQSTAAPTAASTAPAANAASTTAPDAAAAPTASQSSAAESADAANPTDPTANQTWYEIRSEAGSCSMY